MVAYAPTEDATEGEKAKYMAALTSTVKPVPAREHVFVLTDANARKGKRGERGGEQTARCWALMAETCSTKTANFYSVSRNPTNMLF